jgi:signal transduction histidine kinase
MNDPPLILIVDDEPDNFDVIEVLLLREDYQLHYASSGQATLAQLENLSPDVILLDVMMPGMDGLEVCQRVKSTPHWQHIPIIMVTALNTKDDLARCLDAGADDFISKPVNGIELRARVSSMLRIKHQYDALESALNLRKNMAYMIVHDLRNLFTHIAMACNVLETTELDDRQRTKVSQIALAEQRLETFSDSLLMLAKLESDRMILHREPVVMNALVREATADFEAIALQQQVEICSTVPPVDYTCSVDPLVFRRVLDNLLGNALKYAPRQSQIEISLHSNQEQGVCLQIKDSGDGIADELRDRIFQPYETGNLIAGIQQTGLGLAFCKLAIEAHGGTIAVTGNQPTGTIFTITLPL